MGTASWPLWQVRADLAVLHPGKHLCRQHVELVKPQALRHAGPWHAHNHLMHLACILRLVLSVRQWLAPMMPTNAYPTEGMWVRFYKNFRV